MKRYLIGLALLVVVAIMGTIGGMVFAADLGMPISNTLTLGGSASAETAQMTLAWVSVEGGTTPVDDGVTVTWYVGSTYTANLTATNNFPETMTGVYGKVTGWVPEQFTITYEGMDMATNSLCGFWDSGVYYFGPANTGDSYTAGQTKGFLFDITPKVATTLNISITLANGVTDPRP